MTSLSTYDPVVQPLGGDESRPAEAAQPNPLLIIHRGLRGRYTIAIVLGLILGVTFATLAYMFVNPAYQSTALIRVAPTQARIIYQTEDNGQMANWDSFVSAQAMFMQSRRVIQFALGSERLTKVGWDRGPRGEFDLTKGLEVTRTKGSEIITVSFKHEDAAKAAAGVNSIVDAYNELKNETFNLEAGTQERAIEDHIRTLQNRLTTLRASENDIISKCGVADIETHHQINSQLMGELERTITGLRQRIVLAEAIKAPDPASPQTTASQDVPVEQLARHSYELGELLKNRAVIEAQIRDRIKLLPTHREMINLRERLATVNSEITRVGDAVRAQLAAQPDQAALVPEPGKVESVAQLKLQLNGFEHEYELLEKQVREIGVARQQLQNVREEKAEVKKGLDLATERKTALEVERSNTKTGRISIMQFGDVPLEPATDRRIPLTAAGMLGGLGMGVGLIWLLGFVRGGCRFATDVQDPANSAPLLEVLPFVDESDPEWLDLAAHSVHHVRSILNNTRADPARSLVVLVSSATAGEGKSYLANALAHSFAISDHKTVVLDADLLGHQLSHRSGQDDCRGLRDAAHENVDPPVYSLGRNLDIVPAGIRDDFQPEQLNGAYVERVINGLRARYDTIIVDSGPMLGSLEASLLAPIVDRTVLVVGRGQTPRLVRAAASKIRQLGGVLAGFVFNRAIRNDYLSSSYSASVSRQSLVSRTSRPRPRGENAPMSPLLLAMRSSLAGKIPDATPGKSPDAP